MQAHEAFDLANGELSAVHGELLDKANRQIKYEASKGKFATYVWSDNREALVYLGETLRTRGYRTRGPLKKDKQWRLHVSWIK